MAASRPVFVLIHGGWHNASTWDKVIPELTRHGFTALTIDLPGAGVYSVAPAAAQRVPFDAEAFATERSATADITQDARTQAAVSKVREAAALGNGKVVLVGHSAGGVTVSAVAEQVPDLLCALVYIAGFMVPTGASLLDILWHETMSTAKSPGLFIGDPMVIGATRINGQSEDLAYRALLKASFYADVPDIDVAAAAVQLHHDEPNDGALTPSSVSRERFGAVPRHYIRCLQDCAVPLASQDHMIASVDAVMPSETVIHNLESSHSPFLSKPAELADILVGVASQ